MSANEKQIGGNHYKSTSIPDHWDIVDALEWDYFIANATKYLWRLGKKNPTLEGQLQDLEKSIHYLEKKRELLKRDIELENQLELLTGPTRAYVNQDPDT
jgi:hypothetical protein